MSGKPLPTRPVAVSRDGGEVSLINEMLRKIEERHPDDLARHKLQREVRPLPPTAGRMPRQYWTWLVVLLLGASIIWLYVSGFPPPIAGISRETPTTLSPPAATAPVTPSESATAPAQLRFAQELASVPLPASPILTVPDPVLPANAVPKAEPIVAAPVHIEKSPLAPTPRDRADAEYRRAENALASGRSSEALEALRVGLQHDAMHVAVRQSLLRLLLDARQYDEAMTLLKGGLTLQPMQTGWAISLARLQMEQGDLKAADQTLQRSQAYAEANADYAGFQGHLKTRLAAHGEAVFHYQRAVRLMPRDGRWWLGLGLALEADGKPQEAREALRSGLATGSLSKELAAIAEQHLR